LNDKDINKTISLPCLLDNYLILAHKNQEKIKYKRTCARLISSLKEVISKRYMELDEEWLIVFNITYNYLMNKKSLKSKTKEDFEEVMQALSTHCINGDYGIYKKDFIMMYSKTIYINNNRNMYNIMIKSMYEAGSSIFGEKLQELMLSQHKGLYCQICELINNLEEIYRLEGDYKMIQVLEATYIAQVGKLINAAETNCILKAFNLLQIIALKTIEEEHFNLIIGIFRKALEQPIDKIPPKETQREEILLKAAFKHLVVLFKEYYLQYPPNRLLKIVKAILNNLTNPNKCIMQLALNFLKLTTCDDCYYLMLKPWNISSYLCNYELNLSTEVSTLMESIVQTLNYNKELALESTILLAKSHYALYKFRLLKVLLDMFGKANQEGIGLKLAEVLQLIFFQHDIRLYTSNSKEGGLKFVDIIAIYNDFILQLSSLRVLFLEEFKRTKRRTHKNSNDLLIEKRLKQYTKLIKFLMFSIGSAFYILGDEIKFSMDELIEIIKEYVKDISLLNAIAKNIQEIIAAIYYSSFITKLTSNQVIVFIDIVLQIVFKNSYSFSNYHIPSLAEYLRGNKEFVRRVDLETERKSSFDYTKLKYQKDNSIVMHLSIENILNYFTYAKNNIKSEVASYILELTSIELDNRKSSIRKQMNILSELIVWTSSTSLSRYVSSKPQINESNYWLMDNGLTQIITKGTYNEVIIRKAAYEISEIINTNNTAEQNLAKGISIQNYIKGLILNVSINVKDIIKELDNNWVYNLHSIGVLYIGKDCDMTDKGLYTPNNSSDIFLQFISNLGALVKEEKEIKGLIKDELYALEWKDHMNCVIFHINTLMKHSIKDHELIKSQICKNNVVMVWNEKGGIFKGIEKSICFVIELMDEKICSVKVMDPRNKVAGSARRYGSITEDTIVQISFLPRIILRASIVADIKMKQTMNNKKYTSNFLLRQTIIDDIKRHTEKSGKKWQLVKGT